MIETILKQIVSVIMTLSMIVGGYLVPVVQDLQNEAGISTQKLGATYLFAGQKYYLAGSGISSSANSIILTSLTAPVSNLEISMSSFGSIGYATIEPGSTSKREFVSFTGISQSASNDTATLTGVTRGLRWETPYTASSTLAQSHSGGSILIFSNPPQVYNLYTAKANNETITGDWTFNELPQLDAYEVPTDDADIATKKYVDDSTNAGAADAATTTAGIVQIATTDQLNHFSTTTGSSGRLLVPYSYYFATSTDKRGATTTPIMSKSDGYLWQDWINKTEAFAWTGEHTFSATTTMANASSSSFGVTGNLNVSTNIFVAGSGSTMSTTTFTGIPTLPSTTAYSDYHAVNKSYVDNAIATDGTNVLQASSTDNITTTNGFSGNETAILYYNVPANTLGTSNMIDFKIFLTGVGLNTADILSVALHYGSTVVATTTMTSDTTFATLSGVIQGVLYATGTASGQRGMLSTTLNATTVVGGVFQSIGMADDGVSYEDSSGGLVMKVTVEYGTNNANNDMTVLGDAIIKVVN